MRREWGNALKYCVCVCVCAYGGMVCECVVFFFFSIQCVYISNTLELCIHFKKKYRGESKTKTSEREENVLRNFYIVKTQENERRSSKKILKPFVCFLKF